MDRTCSCAQYSTFLMLKTVLPRNSIQRARHDFLRQVHRGQRIHKGSRDAETNNWFTHYNHLKYFLLFDKLLLYLPL